LLLKLKYFLRLLIM